MNGVLSVEENSEEIIPYPIFSRKKTMLIILMLDFLKPEINLALEDKILEFVTENEEIQTVIRFWRNQECLVKGMRKDNHYGWYREEMVKKLKINVFTRSTPGGVVFHDPGNLNWSFYIKKQTPTFIPPIYLFKSAAQVICDVLKKLGIKAYFASPNRIEFNGYKISGMAARSSINSLLVHGTLLFNTNIDKLTKLCIPPPNSPPVINICEINNSLRIMDFVDCFCDHLKKCGYQTIVFKLPKNVGVSKKLSR